MANISAIKLPNGTSYNLKDNGALQLTGGQVTGPVTFGSSVSIDEGTIGNLVVNGNASFANNINANTINGVTVGSSPKFTDTVTTVTTSGSGNAITAISASNGALTATKGSTFLTSAVTSVRVQATSPVVSSVNTAQTSTLNTTISLADAYGDTKNPYGSKTAKYVLAAPSAANGAPSFRALKTDDITPLQSKTFTDVIGTANNWSDATFFFGSVKPAAWYEIWKIKFNILIYVPGKNTYIQESEVMFSGDQGALRTYSCMNTVANHLTYYGVLYRLKQAGFTNGYGHSIGCRFYSSNYPIDTNYKRTIVVDILETENCTFEFYDTCLKYASIPGTGSTNYDTYSEVNWVSNGLQEAGDSDTIDDRQTYFSAKTSASKGVWAGSLFMEDGNGTYQNICAASDGTITGSNRTTATTKIANSSGFKIGGKVFYSNTNYNANTNISGWGVVYNHISLFDSRYAFNTTLTAGSLTVYKPIYLVGTINNGLFYLDQTWWTQTPEDTSKIYVLVGGVYDSTTSNCRVSLYQHNPWYYYDGNKLVPYAYRAENVTGTVAIANGGTGQTTATNAINALLGGLPVWSATPTDTTYFMRQDTGGSASYGKVPFSTLWTYISGKLPSWSQASSKPTYTFAEITSKPTTLSGYGITDANISSGTITLGSNTITPLTSSSTLNAAKLSGAIPSTVTATTQTAGDNSTKIATTAFVSSAISSLPTAMQFIGTVGTNGTTTWANLAAAAAANKGYTYKVITAHSAETGKPAAKAGDTIVSNGSEWIVIPSGDETATQNATTGISIAAHGTGTVIGVQSTTTTASKVTLGTAISVPNVTSSTDVTVPIRADSDTTVPKAASSATTVPIKNASATTVPTAASSATTVPIKDASATACDDITAWSAGSGSASLTFTMDTTDTKKLKVAFSHSHTAPSLSYTARSIIGVQSSTTSVTGVSGSTSIYGVQSSTTSVTGVSGSTTVRGVKTGDNSTTTASKVTLGTAKSIPNVTAATDVTVPIKNSSASTFVTGTTHTVTDNGHTHSI